MDQCITT